MIVMEIIVLDHLGQPQQQQEKPQQSQQMPQPSQPSEYFYNN